MFPAVVPIMFRSSPCMNWMLSNGLKFRRTFSIVKIKLFPSTFALPKALCRSNLKIAHSQRYNSGGQPAWRRDHSVENKTVMYYCVGFVLFVSGCTYGSVLLYRLYCQATGKGGKAEYYEAGEKVAKMQPNKSRVINVHFNADLNSKMLWNFKPQQANIKVHPGETALAFYTAKNPTDEPITGVATYNVLPFEAGVYFNKIQCFCFEEQMLNPHEEVDMPVFFFLDPEYAEDPKLENIDDIHLSYTFFKAMPGLELPLPKFR